MSDKILEVWRLLWPDGLPLEEYERALMMARLVNVAGPAGKATAPDETMGTTEAAKVLGLTRSAVQMIAKSGHLKVTRNGSGARARLVIRRSDLEEFRKTYRRRGRKA